MELYSLFVTCLLFIASGLMTIYSEKSKDQQNTIDKLRKENADLRCREFYSNKKTLKYKKALEQIEITTNFGAETVSRLQEKIKEILATVQITNIS